MNMTQLKMLGNEWRAGDKHRIYINNLDELYGLKVQRYKTGNISGASLDGEPLSNTKAQKLMTQLDGVFGKLWYDVNSQRFMYQNISTSVAESIIDIVRERCT